MKPLGVAAALALVVWLTWPQARGQRAPRRTGAPAAGAPREALAEKPADSARVDVTDEAGAPLEGVRVILYDRGGACLPRPTGPGGRIRAGPGLRRVAVLETPPYAPQQIAVAPGTTRIRIVLHRCVPITGRVLGRGEPLVAATVQALQNGEVVLDARTDSEGRFRLAAPEGETYGLRVDQWGPEPPLIASVLYRARVASVRAGADDLVVSCRAHDRRFTLHVKVRWPDGRPAAGVRVWPRLASDGSTVPSLRTWHTDGKGMVTVAGLPDLDMEVTAFPPDGHDEVARSRAATLVPGGQSIELFLRPAAPIAGTVVDAAGEPIAYADLRLVKGSLEYRRRTRDDGGFRFHVPAEEHGPWHLTVGGIDERKGIRAGDEALRIKASRR